MSRPEDDSPAPDVPLPADGVTGRTGVPQVPAFDPQYPVGRSVSPMQQLRYGRNWAPSHTRSRAELSLIVNTCAALLCFGFVSVAGVVLAALALHRSDESPDSARRMLRASWLCLAASLAVSVVLLITLIVLPAVDLADRIARLF